MAAAASPGWSARPRWRDLLIWQAGEVLYFAAVWWYLGGFLAPAAGGDAGFYWAATLLRMAAELYLIAMVARDLWRPAARPRASDGVRALIACAAQGRGGLAAAIALAPGGAWMHELPLGRQTFVVQAGVSSAGRQNSALSRRRLGRRSSGVAHPHVERRRRLPAPGRPWGRKSIEACMCGGSAKSRCLPSMENGERTEPGRVHAAAGQRRGVGRAAPGVAERRLEADAVGGAAADDQDVPCLGVRCGAGSRSRRRARPRGRRAPWPSPCRAERSPSQRSVPIRGRKVKSGYAARSAVSSAALR